MVDREHGDLVQTEHPSGSKGIHVIQGFPDVVDETARGLVAIVAGPPSDIGRTIRQTAGLQPGWYIAITLGASASNWQFIGDATLAAVGNKFLGDQLIQPVATAAARLLVQADDVGRLSLKASTGPVDKKRMDFEMLDTGVSRITSVDDSDVFISEQLQITANGGLVVGSAAGGDFGIGALNAKQLYLDGTLILLDRVDFAVNQAAHGLAVGDIVYSNAASLFVKAQADADLTLAHGIVSVVADVNNFTFHQVGRMTLTAHGFTVGARLFLSESTAGLLTETSPSSLGFRQVMAEVLDANTILALDWRPIGPVILQANSAGIDSTTGSTFVTKVSITLPGIDEGYFIDADALVSSSSTTNDCTVRLHNVTDNITLTTRNWVMDFDDLDERASAVLSARVTQTIVGGPKTFAIQFAVFQGGGTIFVSDASIRATGDI